MGTRRVSAKARREDGGVKVLEAIFLICEEVGFMREIDAFPLHSKCDVGTAFPRSKRRCFLSFSVQTMTPAAW